MRLYSAADDLGRLADLVAPGGMLTMMAEAYFDESGTHAGAAVLCVAGYVFTKQNVISLQTEWDAALSSFGLPYFRMSECAHGNGAFAMLSRDDRDAVARRVICSVKAHASKGVAVIVNTAVYRRLAGQDAPSAYAAACRLIMRGVASWAQECGHAGDVGYFFEAGAEHQAEANALMQQVFRVPEMRCEYRASGCSFLNKTAAAGLQAADLLAWHACKAQHRQMEGKGLRADAESLFELPSDFVPLIDDRARFVVQAIKKQAALAAEREAQRRAARDRERE